MRSARLLGIAAGLWAALSGLGLAQTPAPIPSGKRVVAHYECSDMRTRVVYDHRGDRLYLIYAAKRIVMMLQPGTGPVRHFTSAKYQLDWVENGQTATLRSTDPNAASGPLATCKRLSR